MQSHPAPALPHSAAVAEPLRASLVLGAMGVVFGDIGTSPLYTLQECVAGPHGVAPTRDNVVGIVSLIVWAVTMVVTVKYLWFLMRADNRGEGGIMALLALVPEKLRNPGPGKIGGVALLVIVGAALLFGDGVITPAISVLSAVEGLKVATPKLEPVVVPFTVAILVVLFAVQRGGTGGLGRFFGPVMIAWFVTIGALGVWHIADRPAVLAALSPLPGLAFFLHHRIHALPVLGGVVLAVTGGEALYADMGHFGRRPIRVAWLSLIYPCLLLCYLGQGALLIGNPSAAVRPFYSMVPPGPWIYPLVALAAAATVIASQALISGVFSLTHQSIRLGFFPRLTVRHTSGEAEGQIYLPLVNWGLALSCIALVVGFGEASRLAAAFGLAVSGTMLITSLVYYRVARDTWGWSRSKALPILLLVFLAFDIPFVVANSLKFFDGGYLPFLIGLVIVAIMASWRIGRTLVARFFRERAEPVEEFRATLARRVVARVPGVGVFLTSYPQGVPAALGRMAERFRVVHETMVLCTVTTEHDPVVPASERLTYERIAADLHRVVLRYGFMDEPNVPRDLAPALPAIRDGTTLDRLQYVLGRETYVATSKGDMGRITESLFELLNRNARNATDYFRIPPEQVIEIGMQIDL